MALFLAAWGIIVDGRLVRFAGGTIGDVGHVIIEPGGRRCSAGCAGCAEGLVGTAGVVDIARAAGAPPDVDRPALVIAGVAAGEAWALRAAERVGRIMGILVASLMPILLAATIWFRRASSRAYLRVRDRVAAALFLSRMSFRRSDHGVSGMPSIRS